MRRFHHNGSLVSALILVRYGELALKSPPVRREFEAALRRNLLDQFVAAGVSCRLRADHGHFYVECEAAAPAIAILRRIFGVTSVSEVRDVPTERTAIRQSLLEMAGPKLRDGSSFAIRARRTGQHTFTSQELAKELGADVVDWGADRHLTVDLERPMVELFVEVRGPRTYLYTDRLPGPGGLPLGVAGRVVALVDGTRGALGAYLMMKRGCRCAIVATPAGEELSRRTLSRFDPAVVIEGGAAPVDESVRSLAEKTRADGIVLSLSVDDYADARGRWGDRVVFSPTVGLTEEEVSGRWRGVEELAA